MNKLNNWINKDKVEPEYARWVKWLHPVKRPPFIKRIVHETYDYLNLPYEAIVGVLAYLVILLVTIEFVRSHPNNPAIVWMGTIGLIATFVKLVAMPLLMPWRRQITRWFTSG